MNKPTALTIAGSDCSGGAGIQADLKTMTINGLYAMSAITALTAQNTQGVSAIETVSVEFLKEQLDSIFTDIRPNAVKIGMVSSTELIEAIEFKLKEYEAEHIVVDPVMVATSGAKLINDDAISALCDLLLPLAEVITPNIPEAELLAGIKIESAEDMEKAGNIILKKYGCNVLVKGGHNLNDANDVLITPEEKKWFYGIRISNTNTHGTGCTLSSAIAANLAKGNNLKDSIKMAKHYLSSALDVMLDLGKGRGPIDHRFNLNKNI